MDNISAYEPSSGNVWDAMLAKFNQLNTSDEEYNDLVKSLPQNLVFANQDGYSHGDMSFDNILYAKGDLYLIDPAWSAIESPLWDVGKILQSVLINWQGIKRYGRAIQDDRPGWMTALCYKCMGNAMLDDLVKKYSFDGVLLATACQLSRVARWCFPEVLIPIIKKLLHIYFNDSKVGPDGNTDALRRII
jgi:thiamine kinase-like enzyme